MIIFQMSFSIGLKRSGRDSNDKWKMENDEWKMID
jgi:hypothetical protein